MAQNNLSQPLVVASELRELTQCLLAATILLDKGQLDVKAQQMLAAWLKALPALRDLTHQFPSSVAAIATRRAIGMLSYPMRARNEAERECAALLTNNEQLRELMADGEWESVAEVITQDIISAYVLSLEGWQL